jgi:hypothetical protein
MPHDVAGDTAGLATAPTLLAPVAFQLGTVGFDVGTVAFFAGGAVQAYGRVTLARLLDDIVPEPAIDVDGKVANVRLRVSQRTERGPKILVAGVHAAAVACRRASPLSHQRAPTPKPETPSTLPS